MTSYEQLFALDDDVPVGVRVISVQDELDS